MATKKLFKIEVSENRKGVVIWGSPDAFDKTNDLLYDCWGDEEVRISLARYRCGHFWVPRRPLDGTAKKSLIWYRYHESGQSWPIRRTSAVIA
jgi:hypothetical protein